MIKKTTKMHQYAGYGPRDFNKYDCLKLSLLFYLWLCLLLRGYIIWIASVSNFQDSSAILNAVYDVPVQLYSDLISGIWALFLLLVVSLRNPESPNWVRFVWRNIVPFIFLASAFSVVGTVVVFFLYELKNEILLYGEVIVTIVLTIILLKNRRFTINRSEFPESVPEK